MPLSSWFSSARKKTPEEVEAEAAFTPHELKALRQQNRALLGNKLELGLQKNAFLHDLLGLHDLSAVIGDRLFDVIRGGHSTVQESDIIIAKVLAALVALVALASAGGRALAALATSLDAPAPRRLALPNSCLVLAITSTSWSARALPRRMRSASS